MKRSTNGIMELKKLKKQATITLIERLSYPKIAQEYNISLSSVNRIIGRKISKFGIKIVKKTNVFKTPNIPFSYNEMDYGFRKRKSLITRQGIVSFKGNSEITETPSELSIAIRMYKQSINI